MNGKRFSNEKARRNGFYLALAVCLVAVGVAAWSTYDAVNGVVEPAGADPGSSQLFQQQALDIRKAFRPFPSDMFLKEVKTFFIFSPEEAQKQGLLRLEIDEKKAV